MNPNPKVTYVLSQGQTREHTPAMWGCKPHWFKLPQLIRNRIWSTYRPGQEVTATPSREYVAAAREAQAWRESQR